MREGCGRTAIDGVKATPLDKSSNPVILRLAQGCSDNGKPGESRGRKAMGPGGVATLPNTAMRKTSRITIQPGLDSLSSG